MNSYNTTVYVYMYISDEQLQVVTVMNSYNTNVNVYMYISDEQLQVGI